MTVRPRVSVVVYGSILDPNDLKDLFGNIEGRVLPVKVNGFKRIFNQEASWRETEDLKRAVLNVTQSPENWFNGILVADLSRSEFNQFRERERGYQLVEIKPDQIERFGVTDLDTELSIEQLNLESQDLVLTTTGTKTRSDIKPIEEYLDICRKGASKWGQQFLRDFLETTELNVGRTLVD